jgi:hypothetical protein
LRLVARVLACAITCVGCYDPTLRDCKVTCHSETECPRPFVCQQPSGFCAAPGHACMAASSGQEAGTDGHNDASDAAGAGDVTDAEAATEVASPDAAVDHFRTREPHVVSCDLTKPFGPAVALIPGDESNGSDFPWLTRDELTVYFSSARSGVSSIYTATRPTFEMPFGAITPVAGLGDYTWDEHPTLTGDELTILFESKRASDVLGASSIFFSTRPSTDDAWSTPQPLADGANFRTGEGGPFITLPGNALYFHSLRLGPPYSYIFHAYHGAAGWSDIGMLPNLESPGSFYPVVSEDELTMFFMSTSVEPNGDIWVSTRSSQSELFAPPVSVPELNGSAPDIPGWLSPDGCRLYFTRGFTRVTQALVASRPLLAAGADAGAPDAPAAD